MQEINYRAASADRFPLEGLSSKENREATSLVSESRRMKELVSVLDRLATSKAPVLIFGEPGSGKARVAHALHAQSPHQHGAIEDVRACDLDAETLVSTANRLVGGALVLLGVDQLDDDSQRALLGILDRLQTRIFATTAVRLEEATKSGGFRTELLYRIQVLSLRVPPLKERTQDLEKLWTNACRAATPDGNRLATTDDGAWARIRRYEWPGNVRELENVARHAVLCAGDIIHEADLPPQFLQEPSSQDEIRLPGMRLRDLERIAIMKTYDATGSAKETADMLGISVRKVHYRLREYRGESTSAQDSNDGGQRAGGQSDKE